MGEAGGEPASAECYCTKLKCVRKQLIINELLVEATGVELITMLTARKLLIPGSATRAKKAPLPVNRQTKFSEEVLWQVRQAI